MQWTTCFSEKSIDAPRKSSGARSHFQRDYDRLIFSSPFRRLQSKTQVFPLPGSKFVHNRLTHSLEVASVGRSLGSMIGDFLAEQVIPSGATAAIKFYKHDLDFVIASACLAHDVGNPAFGHSGEKAISNYFIEKEGDSFEGNILKSYFSPSEWSDLINFEGNANALRQLTKKFKGKSQGGLGLTLTTLASMLKYPCASHQINRKQKHLKKYGYFQADKEAFLHIVEELGMLADPDQAGAYLRHPFVYIVEAADDICYSIIDMEDAHRLGILSYEEISNSFLSIFKELAGNDFERTATNADAIQDKNESVAYLRAKLINALVEASFGVFKENYEAILQGTFNETLFGVIEQGTPALKELATISLEKIYRNTQVLEIELAGYNLMYQLLDLYIPAVLSNTRKPQQETVLRLMPQQFTGDINSNSYYLRVMNVIDHISSMTDIFATEHFRKLKGIVIA